MAHGKLGKLRGIGENPDAFGKAVRSAERARARDRVSTRRTRPRFDLKNDSRLWGMIARCWRRFGKSLLHGVAAVCFARSISRFV
jgi:hypothetical protein